MLYTELDKLFEEVELEEATKQLRLISDRTHGFKKVEANILSPEYFTHKTQYFGWVITDAASGLQVKSGFKTLVDAKNYVKNMPAEDLEKITQVKNTAEYKAQCDKLAAANMDNYDLYESFYSDDFDALDETEQYTLYEAELIDKESQYSRGHRYNAIYQDIENYDEETQDYQYESSLLTDLELINDNIIDNSVAFVVLFRLFDIYINNRDLIKKEANQSKEADKLVELARIIWKKLYNIAEAKLKNDKYENIETPLEALQYYYNAWVSETAAFKFLKSLGWDIYYGTNETEHSILRANTGENKPDFIKCTNKEIVSQFSLELKNYGTTDSMKSYLHGNDRESFHNADYILCYVMASKKWYIAPNSQDGKIKEFIDIPLQVPHVDLQKVQNGSISQIIVKEWE